MENKIFIPKTNKRYSISESGIVYSNYRFNKNRKRIYRNVVIKPHLNNNENKTACVTLHYGPLWSNSNTIKTVCLNTLMQCCFNLTPPDKFHFYDLRFRDGNCFNATLENLQYRIRTDADSNYNFYPQPIYNSNGKITHKICADCGEEKEIGCFNLQIPKDEGHNKTFKNRCKQCIYKKQWSTIKADKKRLTKYNECVKRWAKSKDGQTYYKNYRKIRSKYDFENLTPHYLGSSLRMSQRDLTPTIIQISRKVILLTRTIKQIKKAK